MPSSVDTSTNELLRNPYTCAFIFWQHQTGRHSSRGGPAVGLLSLRNIDQKVVPSTTSHGQLRSPIHPHSHPNLPTLRKMILTTNPWVGGIIMEPGKTPSPKAEITICSPSYFGLRQRPFESSLRIPTSIHFPVRGALFPSAEHGYLLLICGENERSTGCTMNKPLYSSG